MATNLADAPHVAHMCRVIVSRYSGALQCRVTVVRYSVALQCRVTVSRYSGAVVGAQRHIWPTKIGLF